jgi:leucyl aminopeptidase (aminopeptidase T)
MIQRLSNWLHSHRCTGDHGKADHWQKVAHTFEKEVITLKKELKENWKKCDQYSATFKEMRVQASRLQSKCDRYISENMDLRNALKYAQDFKDNDNEKKELTKDLEAYKVQYNRLKRVTDEEYKKVADKILIYQQDNAYLKDLKLDYEKQIATLKAVNRTLRQKLKKVPV